MTTDCKATELFCIIDEFCKHFDAENAGNLLEDNSGVKRRRRAASLSDSEMYDELSFRAHYELVTIHPWADGNGRTSRLLMNLLQMEYDVLPAKVYKEDKAEYIQALIDTREADDTDIFINCMAKLHCEHLQQDIDQFLLSTSEEMVDKTEIQQEMVDHMSGKENSNR